MKKIIAVVFALILTLSMCACANEPDRTDGKSVIVNGFDTQADLDMVKMIGTVGKVSLSDKGARVSVTSKPYKVGFTYDDAALYFPFSSERKQADYTDFSDVEFVVFDVYNETSETLSLDVRLVFADMDLGQMVNTSRCNSPQTFTVSPNAWTRVEYPVRRELIPETEGTAALIVKGMYVEFPETEEDTNYYLNDLRLYKTDKAVPTLDTSVAENEICSFDSYWQTQLIRVDYYWDRQLIPQVRRETVLSADGIGASLKVVAKAGSTDASYSQRYPGLLLYEEILDSVDFGSYPDDAKFCFDIYAPKENGINRVMCSLYSGNTRYFNGPSVYTMPGQWVTASYTVAELNKGATEGAEFATTDRIYIRWSEFTGTDKVFYLDNFRMEMPQE